MNEKPLTAKFQLHSGILEIDTPELEAIRQTVLASVRNPNEVFGKAFAQYRVQFLRELEVADCIIGKDGIARVDAWILERNEDATNIRLVRHPARTPVMHQYYADLVKEQKGKWKVTGFGDRRVTAQR
ncbi:MAG: hypothetical protein P0120_06050 [Nitrospira sp.]|nr:hypothetical protein [Nitrospira sp.]